MTTPCIDGDFFDVNSGSISPKRHWQWHHRATAQAGGASFTPANNSGGTILFTTNIAWTNSTPITQHAQVLMTTGPVLYQLDGLKHLKIRYQWGVNAGAAPPDPPLTDESSVRGYPDFGTGPISPGSSTTAAIYALLQDRQPTLSTPIGDVLAVPAGQTIKGRVQVSWSTLAWGIDWWSGWGDPVPHRFAKVGAVRLDVFSVPVIA